MSGHDAVVIRYLDPDVGERPLVEVEVDVLVGILEKVGEDQPRARGFTGQERRIARGLARMIQEAHLPSLAEEDPPDV